MTAPAPGIELAPATTPGDTPDEHQPVRGWRLDAVLLGLVVLAMVIVAYAARTDGHWWGDDWALYVRQAEGLVDGDVDRVIADNRFTVEQTPGEPFSPPLYPWGLPLLLAPVVWAFGTDLDTLMVVEVGSYAVFLVAWYVLARPRMGRWLGLIGVAVLALSPQYLRWSELIQSELPFLAAAFVSLAVLDRRRVRDSLVTAGAPLWPILAAGAVSASAFTVRREGLAIVAAIGAMQLAALVDWWRERPPSPPWARLAGRLAAPHLAWLGVVAFLQVVLPSTLVPSYSRTSLLNTLRFLPDHLGHIVESLGLKDVPNETPTVLGSAVAGWVVVAIFVVTAAVGLVLAVTDHRRRDAGLVGFVLVVFAIGGSFRYPGSRYMAAVGPALLLMAIVGARWLLARVGATRGWRPWAMAGVVACLLTMLVVGNSVRASRLVTSAQDFQRSGQVEWGPDHPAAVEMFTAVDLLTAPDDVIGFFKARAMTQRTDRRSLQASQYWPVERIADVVDAVVLDLDDPEVEWLEADGRFQRFWSNERFALYVPVSRTSSSASASSSGAGSTPTPSP
jgi:hypothetical protein